MTRGFWSVLDSAPAESSTEQPMSERVTSVEPEYGSTPPQRVSDLKREAEDRFRPLERVGAGGMGAVYRVKDRNLLREAAMKVLNPSLAARTRYLHRFLGEAQIQAQLEHPNILPVHELALDSEGTSYFTMRFVKGRTLAAWIREASAARSLATQQRDMLSAFVRICDAVAFAHSRGVIHCDIKPENIIVEDFGAVYLMDWGLARLVGRSGSGKAAVAVSPEVWSAVTSSGVIGTPAFMSPEQARGEADRLDERTDVYGLGAVLHAIITGRAPHAAPDADAIVARAKLGRVDLPRTGADDLPLPSGIRAVLSKALAPEPAGRYVDPTSLKADVERFLRGGLAFPARRYPAGARIVTEGEMGDAAFVIEDGLCTAFKTVQGQRRTLRQMGPGAVFGETAVLSPGTRTASVEATTDAVVRVVTREALEEGVGLGSVFGSFVVALAERFRELDQQLMGDTPSPER
jgi:tRNA A-37 threonylcarbamoyl transferase component Bud32